jgi:arginyl-tRNA synthetase
VIRDDLLAAVHRCLDELGVSDVPAAVVIERPARQEHGDWSTNAALVCSKIVGTNPRELGQALADKLDADKPEHVVSLEIAGPGFVNFRLANSWLHDVLVEVAEAGTTGYAAPQIGEGKRVNVEFVSANPTGPLHAGHGRWAAYGDTLCRILDRCGFEAHAETYVNDRGTQIEHFGESLAARKRGDEVHDEGYLGQYIIDWAAEMPDGADPVEWGVDHALSEQKAALAAMHVEFDTWSSERESVDAGHMTRALERLREAGHVYEEAGATWLRTTDFGDDKDRVLVKTDGQMTYLLPDIGYHESKFERGDLLIDVLGADHHGYVARMSAALQMLGHPADAYEAIIGQNVKLIREGEEVKLSKRAGNMVLLEELVDDVGPDVTRFAYLMQSIDTSLTIDIDLLKKQSAENPVFYVQYAHARIQSIGRTAAERGIERKPLAAADLSLLVHERELQLLRELFVLPEVVEMACTERAPQKITTWVRELASAFQGFYHDCPVLRDDVADELQQARLWLVEATRIGIAIGLDLLGVDAPERM